MTSRKILFYLMSEKGLSVIKTLISNNLTEAIGKVVIGKDSNVINDFSQDIENMCIENDIEFYYKNEKFSPLEEYSIAISWRWLIEESNSKLIVLHDSLLPKYRGFAPLVNALLNNEPEIGVSAIFATKEFDKGDIITQSKTKVNYPIKINDAIQLISQNYNKVIKVLVSKILKEEPLIGIKQKEENSSYSLWRDEQDYLINWNSSANEIVNFINSLSYPYKGASSFLNGNRKVRVLNAEVFDDDVNIENKNNHGKVLLLKDGCPIVVCENSLIKLTSISSDDTGNDLLPFSKLRIRFSKEKY
tara:strand:- start:5179 stop:6087 length:909 start_codon:yes stop_codon:yes gene_type:complete